MAVFKCKMCGGTLEFSTGTMVGECEYCEKVLDIEPENAGGYFGKLLAELSIRDPNELINRSEPFDQRDNCIKTCRFDSELGKKLKSINAHIRKRVEKEAAEKRRPYERAFCTWSCYTSGLGKAQFQDKIDALCREKAELEAALREDKKIYERCLETKTQFANAKARQAEWQRKRDFLNVFAFKKKEEADYEIRESARAAEQAKQRELAMLTQYPHLNTLFKYSEYIIAREAASSLGCQIDTMKSIVSTIDDVKKTPIPALQALQTIIEKNDCVEFGSYYRLGASFKEPIRWKLLDIKDGCALLLSEKPLALRRFSSYYKNNSWQVCDLREWLNTDFMNEAFGKREQQLIHAANIAPTQKHRKKFNPTKGVFVLSAEEMQRYILTGKRWKSVATNYAVQTLKTQRRNTPCLTWTRSDADSRAKYYVQVAEMNWGSIELRRATDDNVFVQPAIWISLEA